MKDTIMNMERPALIAIIVAVLFVIGQSVVIVEPGFRGVSVTLGKVNPKFKGEGLNFKVPFAERVISIPVKQRTLAGEAVCFSSDLQTVHVSFKTLFRLPEGKVVDLFQKYQGDPYESLVEPRIQEAVKQVAAQYRAEDIVKKRDELKVKTLGKVTGELKGLVYIADITISNIDLTDELEEAIELKQIKEQEALAKTYELDKARKEAEITIVNAQAEAKAVQVKGAALRQAPQVIELEIAKKWDGKTPSTVVVGKGGGNVLLPLR